MLRTAQGDWYSASDLLGWLGCEHSTSLSARALVEPGLREFLKRQASTQELLRPDGIDGEAFTSPAAARGDVHERAMLQSLLDEGRSVSRIARPKPQTPEAIRERADETLAAMRKGVQVVFQATLLDPPWFGYADFLVRVDGVPSEFGDYAYEVRDTKLARHATVSALLQMAQYGAMVELLQGVAPPRLAVWLGTGDLVEWPYADVAPYLLEARTRFLAFRAENPPTVPEPVAACPACKWLDLCESEWGPEDLRTVHRLTRRQRMLLRDRGIDTVASLAEAVDSMRPERMAIPTFDRLRQQAIAQSGPAPYVLIRPQQIDVSLRSIPAPHPLDVYFDLEGDPFAAIPTLDYLWAFSDAAGDYHHEWAHSPEAEQNALRWLLEDLRERERQGGDWHVYHYNSYEITSLRRVAQQNPDQAERDRLVAEVDRLIDERFVDLYRTVEAGLRTRDGSTSLKIVEKLAGYDRTLGAAGDAVAKGDDSILEYERYLLSEDAAERASILERIRDYNAHDVRATQAVHAWLVGLATELAEEDLVPAPEPYVASEAVRERVRRTDDLRARLQEAALSGTSLPSGLSADGALRLAHMLEWHRAEMIVQSLDRLRLVRWALNGGEGDEAVASGDALDADLNGDRADHTRIRPGAEQESVLVDVEFAREIGPKSTRSDAAIVWEFRCRPGSWKVREGKKVSEALPPDAAREPRTFEIEWIDVQEGRFRISKRQRPDDLGPLVINDYVNDDAVWESLMRLGESALSQSPSPEHRLGFAMLDRQPPLSAADMEAHAGETADDRARRLASVMAHGLLPVQGPPGTGKTWVGSHVVADAVERGRAAGKPVIVAITANSHKVINNLMLAAMDQCASAGVDVTFGHVGGKGKFDPHPGIVDVKSGPGLREWVEARRAAGESAVIGATKFAWCRPESTGLADILLIDEAGQLTLADSCAVAQAAPIAVALGDPQQLTAPVQAAHDESVNVSLLEHIAQGRDVLPDSVGVFLDLTYRMHPRVCQVVADLAYDGALASAPPAQERDIFGEAISVAGLRIPVQPGVVWVSLGDEEDEVEATCQVLDQIVGRATVQVAPGVTEVLTWDEVRVVAPHNAHVNRLDARLPGQARVGTVDRFQGQQGHVVVYSMGRLAEQPSDVPFLYELNRLNVALSRARLMAIVISHRDAIFPPVAAPEHLRLASRFIRAVGT